MMKSFHYYDRMYPSQDVASSIGNLIALPLQGQALKNGTSLYKLYNTNIHEKIAEQRAKEYHVSVV